MILHLLNHIPHDVLIAQGTVDSVLQPVRIILARALHVNASAMIAAHNHPLGAVEPSESDRLLTRDLISAARPLGVKVVDHVIVGEESVYSFADSGLLDRTDPRTSS